jgi:molecular chaperone DnaK
VAVGAAIQAGVLVGSEGRPPAGRHATLAGRGNHGRGRTPLIPRNTTVPFEKPKVFSSPEDGQMTVDIHVLQGERSVAAAKMTLGRF